MASSTQQEHKYVLVIGATGKTGLAVIHELSKHPSHPLIHAFCRDTSKLPTTETKLCTSVVKGNARNEEDIQHALEQTKADWIVISIGTGLDASENDIRTVSAQVIANVLGKPDFQHVRVVVVSSIGAGDSRIIIGFGIGKLISYHLRHALADHTGQEKAFLEAIPERTTIVRATGLTNDQATGKVTTFQDQEKAPSNKTDRADLAAWIAAEVCENSAPGPHIVNVTSVKKQQ